MRMLPFLLYISQTRAQMLGECITGNYACIVDDTLISSYNDTNKMGCQERCEMEPRCEYWTHWSDVERCQLFTQCQASNEHCCDCQTGDRSKCGSNEDVKYVSLISGGLNKKMVDKARDSVIVIGSSGICRQPDFLKELETMPRHRWGHVSTFLGSSLIVCGGSTELSGNLAPNDTCDVFDFNTQAWRDMEPMSEGRHQAAGASVLGKFYVTGGRNSDGSILRTVDVYDPSSGQWSAGPEMTLPLVDHCVVSYRDSLVVIGGTTDQDNGNQTNLVISYNVTTNSWAQLGWLSLSRSGHGCSINDNNEIVVTGGHSLVTNHCEKSTEKLVFKSNTLIESSPFTNLPVRISHHVQTDYASVQIYGGDVSSVDRNFVLRYLERGWEMTNVTLPETLSYHYVTRYPAAMVNCSGS